jgi:vacuolar-type H+-ATPase subunit I/STV1
VAGSGPIPFPFAFANGVNAPAIMAHHGYGLSAALIMLLLLLLAGRQRTWLVGIPLVILLSSLALANEVDFALLYFGIVLVALIWLVQNKRSSPADKTVRPPQSARFWIIVFIVAGIFALIQGGMARKFCGRLVLQHAPIHTLM